MGAEEGVGGKCNSTSVTGKCTVMGGMDSVWESKGERRIHYNAFCEKIYVGYLNPVC